MGIAFRVMYSLNIYRSPLIQGLSHGVGNTTRRFDLDGRGIFYLFLSISESPENLRTQNKKGNTKEESLYQQPQKYHGNSKEPKCSTHLF